MKYQNIMDEKKVIEKQLSSLMETTLRLENELIYVVGQDKE